MWTLAERGLNDCLLRASSPPLAAGQAQFQLQTASRRTLLKILGQAFAVIYVSLNSSNLKIMATGIGRVEVFLGWKSHALRVPTNSVITLYDMKLSKLKKKKESSSPTEPRNPRNGVSTCLERRCKENSACGSIRCVPLFIPDVRVSPHFRKTLSTWAHSFFCFGPWSPERICLVHFVFT